MSRQLPPSPSLEQLKKQAKSLLKRQQAADPEALTRIRENHPGETGRKDSSPRRRSRFRMHT